MPRVIRTSEQKTGSDAGRYGLAKHLSTECHKGGKKRHKRRPRNYRL